jgi:hypothetical protein
MSRWLLVLGTVAAVAVALLAYTNNFFQPNPQPAGTQADPPARRPGVLHAEEPPRAPVPAGLVAVSSAANLHNYLPIPDGQIVAIDKQDVPSQRDGKLLYVATEIDPTKPPPPEEELVKVWEFYAYVEAARGEKVPDDLRVERAVGDSKEKKTIVYRRLREEEYVEPENIDRVIIARKERVLRRLHEGNEVAKGQLLAMVDPNVTAAEMVNKLAKVVATKAETDAAKKTKDEAYERFRTQEKLYNGPVRGAGSLEELRGAELTWWKYRYEEETKRATIGSARAETDQVLTTLKQHEIRAATAGIVKNIAHQRGDAIKNMETLLQIVNHDRMRVRGEVGMQHLPFLKLDDEVVVEPKVPVRPSMVLSGHTAEVRGVAVGKKRQIVSASDDRTARVWDLTNGMNTVLFHPSEVRSVVCTGAKTEQNLCLTGGSDGVGRLWDLDNLNAAPRQLADRHRGPIASVAFNPDGRLCVTGGGPQDRTIRVWKVADGSLVGTPLTEHRGEVTSLQFLAPTTLISLGSDRSLIVWKLNEDGSVAEKTVFSDRRTGDVPVLGVNPDPANPQVLVDYGRELRVVSAETKQIEGVLQNASGVGNFATMALFSPDGKTILTHSASENGLQLWRAPTKEWRAFEVRQLVWQDDQITCGAFVPSLTGKESEDFAVTGTRGHKVVVWTLPSADEINVLLKAKIKLIDQDVESDARQVRIWAELDNPKLKSGHRRLMPGQKATMVAYPK